MTSTCPYFLVEHVNESSESVIIPISYSITLFSTALNFLGFYMILKKSKKETRLFRFVLFGNQFFLWLCQGFWAIFMNTMSLFPFPALYSVSFFNQIWSTHTLFCPDTFYISVLVGGWVAGLSLLLVIWSFCNSSEQEQQDFVKEKFPTCQNIFSLPGVLVITKIHGLYSLLAIMVLIGTAAELVYIIASCIVLFELSKQTRKMSYSTMSHHKKIVIDTTVQILIKSLFLATWAFWLFITYFIPPEVDTRVISLIINSLFVAAPIPGTIAMLIQNTVYRRFILEKLRIRSRNPSVVNPQSQYIVKQFSMVP